MSGSRLQKSLQEMVAILPVPAMLVNLSKNTIVDNNEVAVRKFGVPVSRGATLRINMTASDETVYLKQMNDGDLCELIETVEENALFSLHQFSKNQAIVADISGDSSSSSSALSLSPEASYYPSFHFSYLHRMLSGQRVYPDPLQLKKLNLISDPGDSADLDWRSLIVDEDRETFDKVVATAIEHGGNHRLRYRVKAQDGMVHELTDFFSVIREDGMWPVLSGTIVSTEGAHKKMQHIERLCLVGRLVGGMIHDFRNLLGGMQNMMEWCMAQSPEDGPVYKAMEKTVNYTDQANGLIRCTLRLMDGKSDVEDDHIPVKALLEDAEAMIVHFGSSAIKVQVNCDDNVPPLFGQRSVLLDILLNLGLNACDAMEEAGDTLTYNVTMKERRDSTGSLKPHVIIHVIDNGCGMTREQSESIFNEFFTTKTSGAGLGLWMVREGVRSFGGVITVNSRLGVGTEFEVALPVPENAGINLDAAPESEASKTVTLELIRCAVGKKVLFIEDEPLLRSGVQIWLDSMGFEVIVAEDGSTGLNLFNRHREDLDLIIQDFILPGIRGDVLLETFASEAPDIPIIVCSGYPDGRDYNWLVERGAKAFLSKPFRIDKLVAVIKEIFEGEHVVISK